MNITEKELEVLKGIDDNEFGDGLSDAIWTASLSDDVDMDKKSFSGVVSSLTKKGLVGGELVERVGSEATIYMTQEGIDAYIEIIGIDNINKWVE